MRPLIALLFLSLAGCIHQPSTQPLPLGLLPGDTVRIEGRVVGAVTSEGQLWFQGTAGQRPQYKVEFDVRIDSPQALAGLCQRFAYFTDRPVATTEWLGKQMTVTVTKEEAFKMIFFVRPDQVRIK